MEQKIEEILENNMMYDGQLNKTKAITELLILFNEYEKTDKRFITKDANRRELYR